MDSAINGLLQSLDPYSAYMSPKILEQMQTETSGEFGGLGIEVSMEAGVVKVISPIDDTPASKAGLKAGDYIVKINNIQVQGKSLAEACRSNERTSWFRYRINCETKRRKKSTNI
jgi:carboxyl-terminal processing protease